LLRRNSTAKSRDLLRGAAGALRALACAAGLVLCCGRVAATDVPVPGVGGVPADLADYARRFDVRRDPGADLGAALAAATAAGRRVLVMVGGDWCVWCFLLDRQLGLDPEAAALFYGGFEVLRVYYDEDNTNQAFLTHYPDFRLFPHFFVLERDGRLLASVPADVLIRDAKYDTGLIRDFVAAWRVPGR